MSTNTYSLDNLVSFNSKLEDYFTNNTTKAINTIYENFLSKNINKLKNKDKSVLKEIPKLNINYLLIDNLNFLWNSGFNSNTSNFSSNILTTFTNQTKENINKNKKLTTTINKEDIKVAKNIRKRDIEEKRKTLRILKQDIITSDFGNTYLQERNKEIARNFTNTYQEKIFNSISNYFNQKLSITREKNLINHLSFKRLSDLTNEEKAEYINEYNLNKQRIEQIYGLKVESIGTYDSLKFNPKERIRRIANTELSAAYNLARYNELVNQGFTEFQVKNTGNPDCVLCKSKNNAIITLEQIQNLDRGFTDFRGIDTRKNKDASENINLMFPPFHPACRDYLVGVNKTKKILSNALNTINTTVKVANTISNSYLNLANKTNNTNNNVLKAILTTGSIMSLSMMYYFFTKTNLVPNFIVNNLEDQLSDVLLKGTESIINNTNTTIQDQLKTAVLNKDFNQSSLYETGYKPPTIETLSQYLNTQQKAVINKQVTDSIKQLITKANLTEVFKYTIIDANGISGLIELAKNNQEREALQNVQTLVNVLVVNNKTTSKQELLNLIYKEEVITQVVAKIPLNIKQQDLVLINNTENKLVNSTTKLERLDTNITKLNNEVKKNKNNYLKDIETLRELDSQLTDELVGLERVNSEYNQLLETTNDKNLSKYLTDKITENNQKTSQLRNKLNDISADLYGTKLDKVDPNIKNQLIDNIRTKGEQYLDFRNNRTSKIKSINTTLDNAKKDTTIDKLNIEYIDKKLAQLDVLDLELQDLNKNSLILDNVLSDYAILNKIDNNISTSDLGYTFNNYLNTSSKRSKQIANVDNFRETSLTNTATNIDTYKRKLIKAKAKLLNNEEIIEFSRYSKTLCHSKLKNILEKLKKV